MNPCSKKLTGSSDQTRKWMKITHSTFTVRLDTHKKNYFAYINLTQFKSSSNLFGQVYIHIYPTPPLWQDMTQGQFFKRSLTGLNSVFSFF